MKTASTCFNFIVTNIKGIIQIEINKNLRKEYRIKFSSSK